MYLREKRRAQYIGQWKDDEMHGQGTMYNPDGRKYIGSFKYGKYHGTEILYDSDGKAFQEGTFQKGKYVGQ
ncbi:MAG: hypothetical protein FWG13_06050 [Leptospirales bacterium]|nr:hypothetical protein [Leptospirales bacterium]